MTTTLAVTSLHSFVVIANGCDRRAIEGLGVKCSPTLRLASELRDQHLNVAYKNSNRAARTADFSRDPRDRTVAYKE